jgi:hypothetical protein
VHHYLNGAHSAFPWLSHPGPGVHHFSNGAHPATRGAPATWRAPTVRDLGTPKRCRCRGPFLLAPRRRQQGDHVVTPTLAPPSSSTFGDHVVTTSVHYGRGSWWPRVLSCAARAAPTSVPVPVPIPVYRYTDVECDRVLLSILCSQVLVAAADAGASVLQPKGDP